MTETSNARTVWNSARIGDPTVSLPEPEGGLCTRRLGPVGCCRAREHRGQHVAVASEAGVVAIWANPSRPEVVS